MIKQNTNLNTQIGWLLKMAWRDGKASGRKLILFIGSIILGIAAVVSIQSFGENLKENIALQSKELMGADFRIDTNNKPNETVLKIVDSLGNQLSKEISFASMVAFPQKNTSKLVRVRGIESQFPFYGTLETNPPSAKDTYYTANAALVDATLMLQFDLKAGDSIKVGAETFPIAGALKSAPGSNAFFSSVAPPVIIPYKSIPATKLVQTGSRIDYDFYFKNTTVNLEILNKEIDPILDLHNADIDTHTDTSERLGRRYENFGKFLNLVAFIALLLGCVGIASAIHIYIKGKLRAVAVLKCLGATKKQTFSIFLLQIAVLGFLGGIAGTILGLVLQQFFPLFLGDLLPVNTTFSLSAQVVVLGLLLGILMSVLFAVYPLISTLYVSPLQALRIEQSENQQSKKVGFAVLMSIFLFIFLFSFWLLENWKYALAFVVGILVTFSILALVAHTFMQAIKKYFPHSWGFIARQSLLNLFRPQNQTLILVLAIGVGTFLISTLYFTKDILLTQTTIESDNNNPNLILLDIQTNQRDAVTQTIKNNNLPVLNDVPIVTMRIHSIRDKLVSDIRADSTATLRRWILNHEFRVSYRDSLSNTEKLTEGNWVPRFENTKLIPISVSDNFAEDAQVTVGDAITFNVQGVLMPTYVSSIRAVDWSEVQLNFLVVFPLGVLENAPQFRVLTSNAPNEIQSAKLQQELVQKFPNISVIDLRQVITSVEKLLDKIAWLINFMAFFSIFTGIIVLLGAVKTSKFQRIKESILLRTIGARGSQILKITALEYLYLGVLGSLAGILLSLISSQLLAWIVFDTPFVPSAVPFIILLPGITLLVLLIGLGNSVDVIKSPPLQVLRKEAR